jgi:hypothetical protein
VKIPHGAHCLCREFFRGPANSANPKNPRQGRRVLIDP